MIFPGTEGGRDPFRKKGVLPEAQKRCERRRKYCVGPDMDV
jgi:hypothetical protein